MRNLRLWIGLLLLGGLGGLLVMLLRPSGEVLEVITLTRTPTERPAMCPWREPQQDRQAFFPGATAYRTDTLILSSLRTQILQRLGPGVPLESNALYLYRVMQGSAPRGTVLVRRTAGQYGAMEVVVGVGTDGKIAGVRLQRHREPRPVAAALTAPAWLGAFRGKSADSTFRLGEDLPAVPAAAKPSAQAVAQAVRSLLIEFEIGEAALGKKHE